MPVRWPTKTQYDELVAAFREHGANMYQVAKAVGASRGWVKRGWERGWTEKSPWALPIREVLLEEQTEAKALEQLHRTQNSLQVATAELARDYEIDIRRIEERALRRSIEVWDTYTHNFNRVAAAAGRVADSLAEDMEAGLTTEEGKPYSPVAKLAILRDVASVASQITSSLHESMKARRLHDDEPTEIVRHEVDAMTDEEVAEILILASDAAKHITFGNKDEGK